MGFVQYRDPEELRRAMRECRGERFKGKGKDPHTRLWAQPIGMRIDRSTREFDMINLEEDRRRDWETRNRGGAGEFRSWDRGFARLRTGESGMRSRIMTMIGGGESVRMKSRGDPTRKGIGKRRGWNIRGRDRWDGVGE